MKQVFSAGIIVFYKSDATIEYLLLHYEPSGHWDFPKGKIEPGETKQEAALRELKEETGLQADIIPGFEQTITYHFKDYESSELAHKTVYFFVGQALHQNVTLSYEHKGHTWLPYQKALQQLTYKNAQELLKKSHAFIEAKQ